MRLAEQSVGAPELGQIIGISARRIRELRDEGKITGEADGRYILGVAIASYVSGLREQAAGRSSGNPELDLDLTAERARKAKEEADRLEMMNARERGELLQRGDVDAAVVGAFARVRARLISIPAKCAPLVAVVAEPSEAEAVIRRAVYECLRELSDTSVSELCGDYGDVVEDIGPAAGFDGEPMGGRETEA